MIKSKKQQQAKDKKKNTKSKTAKKGASKMQVNQNIKTDTSRGKKSVKKQPVDKLVTDWDNHENKDKKIKEAKKTAQKFKKKSNEN